MPIVRRKRLRTLDLFSGIGGFAYALKEVSKVVAYCEISPYCQRVLRNNMSIKRIPNAPIFSDVRSLKPEMLPKDINMITAGFPCQDISAANPHGKGLDGERSGLVKHVFRLLDGLTTVDCVVMENSPFIRTRGLDTLLKMFAVRGFDCKWAVFSCDTVGAPMLRKRWFCVARRNESRLVIPRVRVIRHNWREEPVRRLVSRDANHNDNVHRLWMLGNAVVPQCLQYAFNAITQGVLAKMRKHPGARIVLRQGSVVYKLRQWASPSTRLSHYHSLTDRSTRMLSNQIFYDVSTQSEFYTRNNSQRLSDIYTINPVWVEWLMGYPLSYTVMGPA